MSNVELTWMMKWQQVTVIPLEFSGILTKDGDSWNHRESVKSYGKTKWPQVKLYH